MAISVLAPVKRKLDYDYPDSDGKPVAESDYQLTPLTYARDGLRHYFRHRPEVYVAGNLLLYYEAGNPRAAVAPDVFVVLGVANHDRSSYLLWEEGKVPDFVLEITSRTTRGEDQGKKRELYRRLGVAEYWQHDPRGEWLKPPLRGLELVAGEYVALPRRELADGTLALRSRMLGLELRLTEGGLRFHDPVTGRNVRTLAETDEVREREQQARERAEQAREQEQQAREQAEQAREREQQAREQAEQAREQEQQAREQAEQAREQEQQAREQAEQAREREQQAREQAEQARERAEEGWQAAAARVAELEALLRRERGRDS